MIFFCFCHKKVISGKNLVCGLLLLLQLYNKQTHKESECMKTQRIRKKLDVSRVLSVIIQQHSSSSRPQSSDVHRQVGQHRTWTLLPCAAWLPSGWPAGSAGSAPPPCGRPAPHRRPWAAPGAPCKRGSRGLRRLQTHLAEDFASSLPGHVSTSCSPTPAPDADEWEH